MFQVGFWEVILTLVVALVVLGPEKLPEVAHFSGKCLAKFKKSVESLQSSLND